MGKRHLLDEKSWVRSLSKDQMTAWVHEGLHSPITHKQLGFPDATWYNPRHERPFSTAAYRLLFVR